MSRLEVFDQTPKALISRIGAKVKEIKVETMVITIERVIISKLKITTAKTTSTMVTMVKEMTKVGHMFHLKIVKLLLGMVEVVWCELSICCRK